MTQRAQCSAAEIAAALGLPTPTPEQQAVIEAPLTSMLVVAGAGSGKTETMSGRVVWLVANGLVEPDRILGLTFTRKAAGELAERIGRRLRTLAAAGLAHLPDVTGDADSLPTVATYHAYAGGLVTEHGLRLGVEPDARLLTEAAAWQYAHEVVVRYDGPMDQVRKAESTVTAAVRDLAGQLAEHLQTTSDLDRYLADVESHVAGLPRGSTRARTMPKEVKEMLEHVRAQRQVIPLLQAYSRTKQAAESLDFSDQMAVAAALAELDPEVARAERSRYSVVLLDEFQDTSEAQMRLLHALFADPRAGATRPVTAVGDPHQSIYGWRGASATTLAAFPTRFSVPSRDLVSADADPLVDSRTDPGVSDVDGPADLAGESTAPQADDPAADLDHGDPAAHGPADDGGSDPVTTPRDGASGSAVGARSRQGVHGGTDEGVEPVKPGVLPLSTSWRNDAAILAVANATAAPLSAASPVPVERLRPSPRAREGVVEAARVPTAADEAEFVADWIESRWWEPGGDRRHTGVTAAVLCRRRAQFAAIADALGGRGIPVEVVGLGGLLTRPEVSDIVSLLRVVHDPSRGDALMRLLVGPFVRLGAADLDALGAWSREVRTVEDGVDGHDEPGDGTDRSVSAREGLTTATEDTPEDDEPSLVEAVASLPDPDWTGRQGHRLSPTAYARLARLANAVDTVRAAVGHPLPELVVLAERTLGLDVEVAAALDTLPETARLHLDAFTDAAAGFARSADRPTLGGFLDWLDAARDEERGLDTPASHVTEGAVQVLTVHAAKGLEWDVVAVPGLVEGAFPSHRSYNPPKGGGLPAPGSKGWLTGLGSIPYDLRGDAGGLPRLPWTEVEDLAELASAIGTFTADGGLHALEEERRLAYVAFTRARHELLLSASVWLDGARPRVTSRFLLDLLDRADMVRMLTWAPDPEPEDTNPALADSPAGVFPVRRDDPRDAAERLAAAWVAASAPTYDPSGERRPTGRVEELRAPAPGPGTDTARAPGEPTAGGASPGEAPTGAHLSSRNGPEPVADAELRHLTDVVDLLLAERNRPRGDQVVAHLPGHLSTSALVSLRTDPDAYAERLRRPMPAPPATAARAGTAFHAWIENHYRSASLVDDLDLGGDDEWTEPVDLDTAKRLFLASPWATATPSEVEISLETVVAGIPVRGRIDAVFPRPGGGVTIVDWKTGAPPSPERLAERSVQLAVYRLAYARWRGLALEDVDAAFYYAATGTTVHPDLPDEDELVSMLARLTAAQER